MVLIMIPNLLTPLGWIPKRISGPDFRYIYVVAFPIQRSGVSILQECSSGEVPQQNSLMCAHKNQYTFFRRIRRISADIPSIFCVYLGPAIQNVCNYCVYVASKARSLVLELTGQLAWQTHRFLEMQVLSYKCPEFFGSHGNGHLSHLKSSCRLRLPLVFTARYRNISHIVFGG